MSVRTVGTNEHAVASIPSSDGEWPELLRDDLLSGRRAVCTWGSGAIGSSAAHAFALVGVRCVAYDISEDRINDIRTGRFGVTSVFDDAASASLEHPVKATTEWVGLEDENIAVHLICVPTERGAEPSDGALAEVIPHIAAVIKNSPTTGVPPLVIVESTILPSWIDQIVIRELARLGLRVGEDVLVGAAPRRDWFSDASHTLRTLPRIVGGCDDETTRVMSLFYGLVCDTVQQAMDAQHAALTKVIENVIRYEGITLANRLTLALPGFDMRHVLRLASTKWNIPYYFPSLGVGGHCIPLAPQYLIEEAAEGTAHLAALRDSLTYNASYAQSLYDGRLAGLLTGRRSIGILGLAYTPDAKMHKLSPAFGMLETLRDTPLLRLHDPFYSAEEIYDLCSVPALRIPRDLSDCDAIILVTAHTEYRSLNIVGRLKPGTVVVDNTGIWSQLSFGDQIEYYEVGRLRGRMPDSVEPHASGADE